MSKNYGNNSPLSYNKYLRVQDLIALQDCLSDPVHHDELLFNTRVLLTNVFSGVLRRRHYQKPFLQPCNVEVSSRRPMTMVLTTQPIRNVTTSARVQCWKYLRTSSSAMKSFNWPSL